MDQNTLKTVLDIEKDLKEMLREEQRRADGWLHRIKGEIEGDTLNRIDRLRKSAEKAEKKAFDAAEEKAAKFSRDAASLAERLDSFGEDRLRKIVWRHLAGILPEGDT